MCASYRSRRLSAVIAHRWSRPSAIPTRPHPPGEMFSGRGRWLRQGKCDGGAAVLRVEPHQTQGVVVVPARGCAQDPEAVLIGGQVDPAEVRSGGRAQPQTRRDASLERGSMRSSRSRKSVAAAGAPSFSAHSVPPAGAMATSPSTGRRTVTRRESGSTRSSRSGPVSATQTEPYAPTVPPSDSPSANRATTSGGCTASRWEPERVSKTVATASASRVRQDRRRRGHERAPRHHQRRAAPGHGPPRAAALGLSLRRLPQRQAEPRLKLKPGHQLGPPIRRRRAARPRLTRLRTTVSESCSSRAISSYSRSWMTRAVIASR